MKTFELRSLINQENKRVTIPKDFNKLLETWKELRIQADPNTELDPLEIFYAGYILANPNVRVQYRIIEEKEIEYKSDF